MKPKNLKGPEKLNSREHICILKSHRNNPKQSSGSDESSSFEESYSSSISQSFSPPYNATEKVKCGICLSDCEKPHAAPHMPSKQEIQLSGINNRVATLQCDHTFCTECIKESLAKQIEMGSLHKKCPICSRLVSEDDYQKLIPVKEFARAESIRKSFKTKDKTNWYFCPVPGCNSYAHLEDPKGSQNHKAVCSLKHAFCTHCRKEWHEGCPCEEIVTTPIYAPTTQFIKQDPCPKCEGRLIGLIDSECKVCAGCGEEFYLIQGQMYNKNNEIRGNRGGKDRKIFLDFEMFHFEELHTFTKILIFPVMPFLLICYICTWFRSSNTCLQNLALVGLTLLYPVICFFWAPFAIIIYTLYIAVCIMGIGCILLACLGR
ncbi:unnamed protein product [Moneuplotes crassus]|uniref:RBR-type E3 ubiquitin transferase n=1 Tax=Euplotes crassus TaxID=5936 RepID=A0AAD1UNT3_EUPCR|nr:unnamed protein product [Moneuplotes crassus]